MFIIKFLVKEKKKNKIQKQHPSSGKFEIAENEFDLEQLIEASRKAEIEIIEAKKLRFIRFIGKKRKQIQ